MGFPCHLCDPTQSKGRKEENAGTPSTAGWIPQGGGRPLLWRFFPPFLIVEKWGPAERVPLRGAGIMTGHSNGQFLRPGLCRVPSLCTREGLHPPHTKSPGTIVPGLRLPKNLAISRTFLFVWDYSPSTAAQRAHSSAWPCSVPMLVSWFQQRGHFSPAARETATVRPWNSSPW